MVRAQPSRIGEQRIAGFVEDFDAAVGRQRVGPHEHRLVGVARERLQLRQIVFQKGRAARGHHHHDAVDQRRLRRPAGRIRHSRACARPARWNRPGSARCRRTADARRSPRASARRARALRARRARRRPPSTRRRRPRRCKCAMRLPAGSLSPQARKPTARSIISSKSLALDHAMVLEDRAIGGMRAGERGGMRGDRAAARLGLADLGDDQRLAGAGPYRRRGGISPASSRLRAAAGTRRSCLRRA